MGETISKLAGRKEADEQEEDDRWFLVGETTMRDPLPVEMDAVPAEDYDAMPPELRPPSREEEWHMAPDDLRALPPVDLQRYTGLWYSVLRTHSDCWEPNCMRNSTSRYTLDSRRDELRIQHRGTCGSCFLCQARAVGIPVPGHNDNSTMDVTQGPRNFHMLFCLDREGNDTCCTHYCCPVGSYQILHVGYMSEDGRTVLSEPVDRPPVNTMDYTDGVRNKSPEYDFAVIGNSARDKAWLLMRRPVERSSPFHDRHQMMRILRKFGYPDTVMADLHFVWHTNPEAHQGKNYVRCIC